MRSMEPFSFSYNNLPVRDKSEIKEIRFTVYMSDDNYNEIYITNEICIKSRNNGSGNSNYNKFTDGSLLYDNKDECLIKYIELYDDKDIYDWDSDRDEASYGYLRLDIKNNLNDTVGIAVDDLYVNGYKTTAIGLPDLLPDRSSLDPIIFSFSNLPVKNKSEINEIKFSIRLYDNRYNDIVEINNLVINPKTTVTGLRLNKEILLLNVGDTGILDATIAPSTLVNKTITWKSENPGVAKVDSKGNVTAINHGETKIIAETVYGKTAKCMVRVNFADVASTSQYYYKPVYWAAENKITTGSNGLFAPHSSCTREHAITFLWRMAGSPQPKSMVSKFKDIQNKNSYSYKAIMWGTEKGIITGSGGVFAPNNTCTREQIVTMLWRLAGKPVPKSTGSKFKDVQNKNSYSYNAILWASEKGITTGANGEFKPAKTCTRAEIVTFIYRYKNTVK